jgi:hypothetical protein
MQLRVLVAVALLALWILSLCVYRQFFSPLAKFPGPKLTAVTGWIETYHDAFRGGQFIFKLGEWHAKYGQWQKDTASYRLTTKGPIVRINPWEIHVVDPEFADVLFASNSKFDKKLEWKHRTGIPHSSFDTIEHNQYVLIFSLKSITKAGR